VNDETQTNRQAAARREGSHVSDDRLEDARFYCFNSASNSRKSVLWIPGFKTLQCCKRAAKPTMNIGGSANLTMNKQTSTSGLALGVVRKSSPAWRVRP
jgi:hypothetical protein